MARFQPKWRGLAAVVGIAGAALVRAGGADGDLYYTTYNGGQNVWRVHYNYDGISNFTLSGDTNIASANGADGIIFAPNGDLLIGGQGTQNVHQYTTGGTFVGDAATNTNHDSDHVVMDPNGNTVYSMGYGGNGALSVLPFPLGSGTGHSISGDSSGVTSLGWDNGQVLYTFSGPGGNGDFGTINLSTYTTTRLFSNVPAAHGMSVDSYTGDVFLYGSDHISQMHYSGGVWSMISDREFQGSQLDQGTTDGKGHLFVADNNGHMLFIDYSGTGLIGSASNYTYYEFYKYYLDDLAPLSGPGSNNTPGPLAAIPFVLGLPALYLRRRKKS